MNQYLLRERVRLLEAGGFAVHTHHRLSPSDGGRALGCALALLAGPDRAERIGRGLDLLCAGAALGAGLLVAGAAGNVTLLLAGLWMAGMISQENWRPFRPNRACHRGEKPVKYRVR